MDTKTLICVLFIGFSNTPLYAQEITKPTLSQAQQAENKLPEYNNLQAGWWRYFDVETVTLNNNIKSIQEYFEKNTLSIPDEYQEKAKQLKTQLLGNLKALSKLRQNETAKKQDSRPHKESYTPEEWLIIDQQIRSKQKEIQEDRAAIGQLSRIVATSTKRQDNQLANYLSADKAIAGRILSGLELMVSRSALELTHHKLQRQKQGLIGLEETLDHLSSEKNTAEQRLTDSIETITELEKEISKQKEKITEATEKFTKMQANTLQSVGETPEFIEQSRFNEQKMLQAESLETMQNIKLMQLELRRTFAKLLSNSTIDLEAASKNSTAGQNQSRDTLLRIEAWKALTLLEQNRAQGRLLGTDTTVASQRINEQRLKLTQDTLLDLQELNKQSLDLRSLTELFKLKLAKRQGLVKHWWTEFIAILTTSWKVTAEWFSSSLFKIGDTPVTLFGIFRVGFILLIAWTSSRIVRRTLGRIAERKEKGGSALYTVGRLAHYVILTIGLMVALSSIGLDFSNLALVAGALSVGIGFGLQSIVNNFVSGLILLFEGSLKVGDYIELDSGVRGEVKEINVRSTLVNTNDNIDIIVPNSELVAAKVTNWTLRDTTRRVHIPFAVAYGTNKERVKEAVLKAADKVPFTHRAHERHEPEIWLVGFGESSLDFELLVWVSRGSVKRPSSVMAAYLWEIESMLSEYNIEIPFPQRDLHLRTMPTQNNEELTDYKTDKNTINGLKI